MLNILLLFAYFWNLSSQCNCDTKQRDKNPITRLRCCHILTDKGNGRRTDRKKCKICLSGGESRLGGDVGPRGGCKERIKPMNNAYVPEK